MNHQEQNNLNVMKKMIGLVAPMSGWMALAVILGILGFLCAIWVPVGAAWIVVSLLTSSNADITLIAVSMLVAAVLRGALRYGEQASNHYIAFKLLALLRDRIFGKLRTLAPSKLEGQDKGNLISVITSDIELLEVFYAHTISPIIIAVLTSIILLICFWLINPIFMVIALLGYLYVGLIIPKQITKLGKETGNAYRKQSGELSAYVLESLRGIEDIKQFNYGEERLSQMRYRGNKINKIGLELRRYEGKSTAWNTMAIMVNPLFLLFCGLGLFQHGAVSIQDVILGTVLLFSSFGSVVALSNLSNNLLLTLASGRRVLALLDEVPLVQDIIDQPIAMMEDLHVDDVSFGYGDKTILRNFHLNHQKGGILGIHGPSGCGKSTLLKLLMRFFETKQGTIRIGDRNLASINTDHLRSMQSYMTQDTILFQDTIENNIKIADLTANREAVMHAAGQAGIHDFIMSLPKGYETPVAELGDSLSGGERQRIGLARIFLHDADFILLDEPTSNLDALHEGMILKSMQALQGKTILLVSHRRSTLHIADQILDMNQGTNS